MDELKQAIPFNKPFVPAAAVQVIGNALTSLQQQGDGHYSRLAESRLQERYDNPNLLLTPSCTASLELSFMLMNLQPDDEVIMPSYTFPSAATAVTKFWGRPVFCDVDENTGCLDVTRVRSQITEKTKAISWVNYAGNAPDRSELQAIARDFGLYTVEDAAHNFGESPPEGGLTVGDFVTFSFHATKNFQCGEGGAILIRDSNLYQRSLVLREKGTNRRDFSKGVISKYRWIDRGSSYLLAEINSALLLCQLDEFQHIQDSRRSVIMDYLSILGSIEELGWRLLKHTENASHMFALLAPSIRLREEFIAKAKSKGIAVAPHYEDLASSTAGLHFSRSVGLCDASLSFSSKIVRLPVYPELRNQSKEIAWELLRILQSIQ